LLLELEVSGWEDRCDCSDGGDDINDAGGGDSDGDDVSGFFLALALWAVWLLLVLVLVLECGVSDSDNAGCDCDDNDGLVVLEVLAAGAAALEEVGPVVTTAAAVVDTVSVCVGELAALYKDSPAYCAWILYVPVVVGAINPDTAYCPNELVVVDVIVIGEVAVNVIVFEARAASKLVSVRVPDTL
jgi:hypothetical protein